MQQILEVALSIKIFFSNALELASVNEENSPKWLIEVEK